MSIAYQPPDPAALSHVRLILTRRERCILGLMAAAWIGVLAVVWATTPPRPPDEPAPAGVGPLTLWPWIGVGASWS